MDAPVPDSRPPRESFFKLILLYPALAIAAIGAIPQYIQVFKAMQWDVPVNSVNSAERDRNLWVKNIDCGDGKGLLEASLADNTRVVARVCPSGDVLVKVKRVTVRNCIAGFLLKRRSPKTANWQRSSGSPPQWHRKSPIRPSAWPRFANAGWIRRRASWYAASVRAASATTRL